MIRLDVWLTLPSAKSVKAGSLVVADPDAARGGRMEGQFRYASEYLELPEAFPLDPLNLKLSAEVFDANRPRAGVHSVFEDSLPDDWGRRLMTRHNNLKREEQRVPNLLRLLGSKGLGALGYVEEGAPDPETASVSSRHLQELALLAEKFEQDPAAAGDDEFSLLFQAGSSPGGARPKALVTDENGSYLAKFASAADRLDVVSLEAAAMELGRRAGLETADTRLVPLGKTKKCLLVKRFDISKTGGRDHLVSMQTLLGADDYYNAGYSDLADVIRHVSSQPAHDLDRLYRQMVFNVLIGNTDDHLKNFLMMHDDAGWRLSPAFDLIPNIGFNREHVLRIGLDSRPPDCETLLAASKAFGIKRRQKAEKRIKEVHAAVSKWPDTFKRCQVPARDADRIGNDIRQRMKTKGFESV